MLGLFVGGLALLVLVLISRGLWLGERIADLAWRLRQVEEVVTSVKGEAGAVVVGLSQLQDRLADFAAAAEGNADRQTSSARASTEQLFHLTTASMDRSEATLTKLLAKLAKKDRGRH